MKKIDLTGENFEESNKDSLTHFFDDLDLLNSNESLKQTVIEKLSLNEFQVAIQELSLIDLNIFRKDMSITSSDFESIVTERL